MSREIKYGAIPTVYRGMQMRSRLEAKIAGLLDHFEYHWDYEPFELGSGKTGYIPDFIVEFPFGTCLLECKPAVAATEFKAPCRKITRSGWLGTALVIGSQLALAPDDRPDLTLFGSANAEDGKWSRVGRGRWPKEWGEYVFAPGLWEAWCKISSETQWRGPALTSSPP